MIIIGGYAIFLDIVIAALGGWVIFFLRFPIPYLSNLFLFGLGVFMAAGGIMGMARMKK